MKYLLTILFISLANIAPVVTITAPADNSTVQAGTTLILKANATDKDGKIAKVVFLDEGYNILATDLTAPYSANIYNVQVGTRIYRARAYDNSGSYRTASITVTVIDDFSSQITALEKRVKVLEDSVRSLSRPDTAIFEGATVTHESPYKHRIKILK